MPLFTNTRVFVLILLAASLLVRIFLYYPYPPMWDASAYVLMGKYLVTHGGAGLVEPFRPLAWPMYLGFFYSLGIDPIIAGTLLQIAMTLSCIWLVWRIGAIVYGASTGLIAAALLALSPSFMFWGNALYSEIPAVFAGLLAFYFFLRRWYFLAGICAGLTFFTKFTQIIVVFVLLAGALMNGRSQKTFRPVFNFILGGIVMGLPFLMLHQYLYGDVLYPFLDGSSVYNQVHSEWLTGMKLTLAKVLIVDPVLVAVPVGLIGIVRADFRKGMIAVAAVLSLAWIGKMPTSIVRYALLGLPFLYLLSAHGLVKILAWSKDRRLSVLVWIIFIGLGAVQAGKIARITFPPPVLNDFQSYIRAQEGRLRGKIWVSSPSTLALSDLKAHQLIYYPAFDLKKAEYLQSQWSEPDAVFIYTRDIPCAPVDDLACKQARASLLRLLSVRMAAPQYNVLPDGHIRAIFRKK